MSEAFSTLKQKHYGAIYADPPWGFNLWWGGRANKTPAGVPSRSTKPHYEVMKEPELNALPVGDLAADDCVLFLWICWPIMPWALRAIEAWGFEYETCAFCWVKAHARQVEMFQDDIKPHMTLGYWTRSNSEVCLLATKGKPKRLSADVRQAIIEPRREHSRKPEGVHIYLNGSPQPCTAGTDYQYVVMNLFELRHYTSLPSVQIPMDDSKF